MKRLFVFCFGLLFCFSAVVPIAHAEQAMEVQEGFLKDTKGELLYVHPSTHQSFRLDQPSTALKILRTNARFLTKPAWKVLSSSSSSTMAYQSRLIGVVGTPGKIWYLSQISHTWYFFDGTKKSFELLRRQISQTKRSEKKEAIPVRVIQPPPLSMIQAPLDSSFVYTKQGTDHIIVMDVSKDLQMQVITGHDSIRPTEECRYPKYCKAESRAESFASYLKRLGRAPLIVNGGYFDAYSKPLNEENFHTVSSDLVIDGKMASMYGWDKAWGDGGMIAQKKDGTFAFYYPIRNWVRDADMIQAAVSNYPLVLLNGVPRTKDLMPVSDPNDYKFWLNARRGGLGLSIDGTKVIYVSVVGTVESLGRALLDAGAANGFALDAGGSNSLAFQGKTIFSPGRKLASVITFRSK